MSKHKSRLRAVFVLYADEVDKPLNDLIHELDEWFSKLVRLLHADWKGEVVCYTCIARGRWEDFDCGHFISRACLILRFCRDNARPQCRDCNRNRNGMPDVFEEELRDEIGDARVDEMKAIQYREAHYDTKWYEREIAHTKTLVKTLLSRV